MSGGGGNDRITTGPGLNRYAGGAGSDVIDARNGRRELVSCGSGRDRVRADRRDRVSGCERVSRG
jgi:Ca2+-binding RTX toxin-like protein